ncbi:hypothetical protein ILYODFUR_023811 [Ilyodon furcidens]|uniref:Secreted protein n=1 Tax=Ilyodon furcidens TaxID=33524 RepID=A0ABV0U8J6_9TELE
MLLFFLQLFHTVALCETLYRCGSVTASITGTQHSTLSRILALQTALTTSTTPCLHLRSQRKMQIDSVSEDQESSRT